MVWLDGDQTDLEEIRKAGVTTVACVRQQNINMMNINFDQLEN